jgi:hypothetical protein
MENGFDPVNVVALLGDTQECTQASAEPQASCPASFPARPDGDTLLKRLGPSPTWLHRWIGEIERVGSSP